MFEISIVTFIAIIAMILVTVLIKDETLEDVDRSLLDDGFSRLLEQAEEKERRVA